MKTIFSKTDFQKNINCRITTSLLTDGNDKLIVAKRSVFPHSHLHLINIKNNKFKVDSDKVFLTPKILRESVGYLEMSYIDGVSFEDELIDLLEKNPLETIKLWKTYLKLIKSIPQTFPLKSDFYNFKNIFLSDEIFSKDKWIANYYYDLSLSNLIKNDDGTYLIDFESWFDFPVPESLIYCRTMWQQVLDLQPLIKRASSKSFENILLFSDIYVPKKWLDIININKKKFIDMVNINNLFYKKVLINFSYKKQTLEKSEILIDSKLDIINIASINNGNFSDSESFKNELEKSKNELEKSKNELEKSKNELEKSNNNYQLAQSHLNKIYSGRIWKMSLKYFSFRDKVIKKFQQKIGFRRHLKKMFLKAKLILNGGTANILSTIENYEILSSSSNLKELSVWLEKRSNDSFDFFIFGITSFNYRHQRPQHVAEELAHNGHRVFYIENEFSLDIKNGKRLIEIKKQSANIYLVKLHSDRNYFIYNQKPNQSDIEHMINSLKKIINVAKVINPISKIDHPFWGNLRSKLSMPVIYDCMDDHSGFKENGEEISNLENDLILNSDLVLVSSDVLMKKISSKRKGKTIILRNAGEYSHFIRATKKETKIPSDLKEIKSKYSSIIGYYGAIADWFDEDLIRKLAIRYPKSAIVLIGLVTNDELKKISKTCKNIFLLGEKPYQELPNYLKFFDICTIPFKLIPLIKATNPVKIYEYLSTGKAVVATDMPELKPLKSLVYLANTHEKFISLVGKAIKENTAKELIDARKFFAKNNTWEKRISSLNKDLFNQFFPSVSIILLSYGKWEFTKDCFKSLYERTFYPNFDSILIDNKSDAETVDFIKNNIDGKYPKLKVFYESKNTGFGGGNNIGMKKAKGEYIILLNNDTKLTPGWISRLVYHASRKGVGLVGPATNNIGNESKINIKYDNNNQVDIENKSREYTSEHWGKLLDLNRIAAFCWIKSRETYEKIGGFDDLFFPAFFEDDDYCKRIKKAGLKIYCADDVFVNHFLSASTKADPTAHNKMFLENKARFEKKWNEKWLPHKYRV